MDDLRVIGVENGALLVSANDGERFRLPVDEMVQSKLRQSAPDAAAGYKTAESKTAGDKLSPKEIQSQIRSGMSAEDVASLTGMNIDHIRKYEGPVLAERENVVLRAQGVPVHTALEVDFPADGMTFGTAIMGRLHVVGGANERWASWKDPVDGWVVKLSFTTDEIDHDARWRFDPKKLLLAPLNNEAKTLSQQGEIRTALIPRLHAVSAAQHEPDSTRFDSGAFAVEDEKHDGFPRYDGFPQHDVFAQHDRAMATPPAPIQGATPPQGTNHTADLLDALRRRRGERETATYDDDDSGEPLPSDLSDLSDLSDGAPTHEIRLVEVPLDGIAVEQRPPVRSTSPQPFVPLSKSSRKGRIAMPSWDDIVFGTRSDDDLA